MERKQRKIVGMRAVGNIRRQGKIPVLLPEAAMAKFDLPLPLLERLLASRIVPLQAKIEAIVSWRDELMEANSVDPRASELEERLSTALMSLARHVC